MKKLNIYIYESLKKKKIDWNGIKLTEYKDSKFNRFLKIQPQHLKGVLKDISNKESMPKYTIIRDDFEDHGRTLIIVKPEDVDSMKKIIKKYSKDLPYSDGPVNDNGYTYWSFV